jgi:hypothetical protein
MMVSGKEQQMLSRLLRRMLKEENGAVAAMFALSLLFVVPLLVLAVDMTYGYFVRAKLQTTSSIAALAAASQLNEDKYPVVADMKTAARNEADFYADTQNMGVGQDGDVTNTVIDEDIIFGMWREDGDPEFLPDTDALWDESTMERDAVKVFARRSDFGTHDNALPLFIGAILPELNVQPYAVATADLRGGGEICLLALDADNLDAIWINGDNLLKAEGCGICSNGGIHANGTPTIDVTAVDALDDGIILYRQNGPGLKVSGNNVVLAPWPSSQTPIDGVDGEVACADPIASQLLFDNNWDEPCVTDPVVLAAAFTKTFVGPPINGKEQINLQMHPVPDYAICGEIRKTGSDFIVDGQSHIDSTTENLVSLEFMPGVHHFKANSGSEPQDFNLNGGSDITVSGFDVTILLSDIQLDWLGASVIELHAPHDLSDLTLPGFEQADSTGYLIHQNPGSPGPADGYILEHELGGSNGAVLDGMIYTGMWSELWFHGTQNTDDDVACLAAIAGNFLFSGTTDVTLSPSNCSSGLALAASKLITRIQD